MRETLSSLYDLIDPSDRGRLWVVFILTVLLALSEAVGVASIMPFVSVASDPTLIDSTPYLAWLYARSGLATRQSFMLLLGTFSVVLLIGSLALRAVTQWAQLNFAHHQIASLGGRLVNGYLSLPYSWYLNRNSSDLGAKVLTEVGIVVQGTLSPLMSGLAHALVSASLFAVLIAADPILALTSSVCVCLIYGALFLTARGPLSRSGAIRMRANADRYRALAEAFGGIKEVKKSALEPYFLDKFATPSLIMAKRGVSAALITEIPSLVMQAVIFGGMLIVIIYLMQNYDGLTGAVPVVALYALGGTRLMPSLQGLYRDFSQARFNGPAVVALNRDWQMMSTTQMEPGQEATGPELGALSRGLRFQSVTYQYPNAPKPSLSAVTLSLSARSTTGIVGLTGSGKTTLVDVLLGLLRPQSGRIEFDGEHPSPGRLRTWQRRVGYVPQNIFLCDDTMEANIAFGVPPDRVDRAAIEKAAQAAGIHDFIVDALPEGYKTVVGERGVRLSGGQRQRIGIARALYSDPDTLILDEATSALDSVTEQAVLEAIYAFGGRKTIVVIAHRLSTIRNCDQIIIMEAGQVVGIDTYDRLVEDNEHFRRLVEAANTEVAGGPA